MSYAIKVWIRGETKDDQRYVINPPKTYQGDLTKHLKEATRFDTVEKAIEAWCQRVEDMHLSAPWRYHVVKVVKPSKEIVGFIYEKWGYDNDTYWDKEGVLVGKPHAHLFTHGEFKREKKKYPNLNISFEPVTVKR